MSSKIIVGAEGLEPTNSEETRFTVWRRSAWLCFQVAHRTFIYEGDYNSLLTVAYGPSVTLDCSFIAPRGGLEPPTIALTGRRSTY